MKKLLLSTALAAATTFPVFAQDADNPFRAEADPMEIHASNFIGMRVYRSEQTVDADAYEGVQQDWDDIGEINDVILSRDGNVEAVLVDIGGFLGIGENQVAVDMDAIRFVSDSATADDEGDFFLVMNAPRDVFEQAPTYETSGAMHMDEAPAAAETEVASETDPVTAEETEMAADAPVGGVVPIERDGYVAAEEVDLTTERLTGAPAYDANDEWIGEVSELLLNDDGQVRAAIVDVGGFLGIGEKPVELEMSQLDILRTDDGSDIRVYISMTKEEMEALPDYQG